MFLYHLTNPLPTPLKYHQKVRLTGSDRLNQFGKYCTLPRQISLLAGHFRLNNEHPSHSLVWALEIDRPHYKKAVPLAN